MKYLLALSQKGEGCDYTIGCATTYEDFDAGTDIEALKKAKEMIEGYTTDEVEIKEAWLAKDAMKLPVGEWDRDIRGRIAEEENKEFIEQEKKELERLKAKYNG